MAALRRIGSSQVRLGMFIHGFEGPWLSHPFWRRRFLVTTPKELDALRTCSVVIVIDESRGLAATPPQAAVDPRPATSQYPSRTRRTWISARAPLSTARAGDPEVERARTIVRESKRAIRGLFGDVRLGKAVNAASVASVVDAIAASIDRSPLALIGVSRLKNKDEYTYLHSVAVCALMINFARHLSLDEPLVRRLGLAGLLHDIGKMAIPLPILNKPGGLTAEEFEIVRGHPERGAETLLGGSDVPEEAIDICRHHHEKVDGSGYPYRLKDAEISLHARMGAICDVYDALTSNRIYKKGWTPSEAVGAMHSWSGHLDTGLLFKFFQSIGIFPPGMLVRLRSNRLAVVLDNGRRGSRLKVRVFHSIPDQAPLPVEDISLSDTLAGDQVVSEEDPARWGFDWPVKRRELIGDMGLPDAEAA